MIVIVLQERASAASLNNHHGPPPRLRKDVFLAYYFIAGENVDQVIGGYRTVTGKAPMMPKWAMDLWQCRERYQTQQQLLDVNVLECPRCGGRMRILCAVNPPSAIRKILDCLGLPSRPPPHFPAAPSDWE